MWINTNEHSLFDNYMFMLIPPVMVIGDTVLINSNNYSEREIILKYRHTVSQWNIRGEPLRWFWVINTSGVKIFQGIISFLWCCNRKSIADSQESHRCTQKIKIQPGGQNYSLRQESPKSSLFKSYWCIQTSQLCTIKYDLDRKNLMQVLNRFLDFEHLNTGLQIDI